jgi:7-cyano-7-deazaguanine reductase
MHVAACQIAPRRALAHRREGKCPSPANPEKGRRYTRAMATQQERQEFVALGHAGSKHYVGLETFPNPGVERVEMTSDELSSVCPITGQADFYAAKIDYRPGASCVESKSLKLYLARYRNEGVFCEELAVKIRDDVAEALGVARTDVRVILTQKPRGGITIVATA